MVVLCLLVKMRKLDWFFFVWMILLTATCGYTLYHIKTIEPVNYSFKIEVVQSHELRHFEDWSELEDFLETDTTNLINYRGDFKCLNFAEALSRRAMESGFCVVVLEDAWASNVEVRHAYNMAYCVAEDTFYVIEAQSDRIVYEWSYTREVG